MRISSLLMFSDTCRETLAYRGRKLEAMSSVLSSCFQLLRPWGRALQGLGDDGDMCLW